MARKIQASPEETTDQTPEVLSATPVEIVELDDVIEAESRSPEEQQAGVRFYFGEIGLLLKFPDQTSYLTKQRHAFITDRALIENITAYAKAVPTAKIFIQ